MPKGGALGMHGIRLRMRRQANNASIMAPPALCESLAACISPGRTIRRFASTPMQEPKLACSILVRRRQLSPENHHGKDILLRNGNPVLVEDAEDHRQAAA